jgi:hypothetical protein
MKVELIVIILKKFHIWLHHSVLHLMIYDLVKVLKNFSSRPWNFLKITAAKYSDLARKLLAFLLFSDEKISRFQELISETFFSLFKIFVTLNFSDILDR